VAWALPNTQKTAMKAAYPPLFRQFRDGAGEVLKGAAGEAAGQSNNLLRDYQY
jgi:hypothetical protein